MRSTKQVVTQFCFYDRTGIQKMLEKQAAKGWMLESIGQFTWKYRRTEPKKLHFAVTYYPKASMFDPYPTVGEELYQEFVAHSGWQFVASNAQLQIFCTEAEDPVPIETDPVVELENIHKAVKKSFLPGYFLMLFCALLNLGLIAWRLHENFTGTLAHNANLFTIFCWISLAVMEIREIGAYYLWRRKALKAAALDGSFVETKNRNNALWIMLAVILGAYILMLASLSARMVSVALITIGMMAVAVTLILLFTKWMKKTGFSREDNRAFTIVATVFVSIAVTFLSTVIVMSVMDKLPDDHVKDTYEMGGITVTRYGDDVPLTVTELTGEDMADYSTYKNVESSILIDRLVANQHPDFVTGSGGSTLRYVVVDVKFAPLFDACLKEYLNMYHDQKIIDIFGDEYYRDFHPTDPSAWGADRAWQLYSKEEARPEYLLVYGNRIVNFDFSEEPTSYQMELVARILGNEQKFENNKNK